MGVFFNFCFCFFFGGGVIFGPGTFGVLLEAVGIFLVLIFAPIRSSPSLETLSIPLGTTYCSGDKSLILLLTDSIGGKTTSEVNVSGALFPQAASERIKNT